MQCESQLHGGLMDKMPDGNTAALRQYEREQARRESFMPTFDEARDDLADRLMSGETYPPKARAWQTQVSISTVMQDYLDSTDLEDVIRGTLFSGNAVAGWAYAHDAMCGHVRDYLNGPGSEWVERRRNDIADEAEEDAR